MKFQFLLAGAGAIFLISGCGSLNDGSLGGGSATISLTIQNPDPNATGTAKAVSGVEQSKAASSSSLSTCTLSASGPNSASTTATVPSGASQIQASLAVPVGNGYTITAECLDGDKTSNSVGAGIRGSVNNINISGSDSVSISALFLNLASRSSGDVKYCRIRQDSTTQMQIVCGFNGALTSAQKTTAQCNIEVDTSLAGSSPTTVDANQGDGFVVVAKGRPYFILGPGLNTPACDEYNTSGTKILRCAGSWSTDADGNTVMQGTLGVRQAEAIAAGRNARFAATCSLNGSTWVAIPSSGMAEFKTSAGGNGDVANLSANGSSCTSNNNCSSGFCAGSSLCASASLTSYSTVSDAAGSGTAGTAAGSATSATFNTPIGACFKPNGNGTFVMDFDGDMIRYIDFTLATTSSSYVTNLCATGTAGNTTGACATAQVAGPKFCIVNAVGDTVYFTQQENHLVSKITPLSSSSGQLSTVAGTGATGFVNGTGTGCSFNTPRGIAIDGDGNLYIADSSNHAIRMITPSGVCSTLAGGTQGNSDGTGTSAKFNVPFAIAIDSTGTFLYVTDANNKAIRKVNRITGVVTTIASGSPLTANMRDIAISPNDQDTLLVADTNGILKVTISTGSVSTFAGNISTDGSTNGALTTARFSGAAGIAISPEGNTIYIGDSVNNKIRKIQ